MDHNPLPNPSLSPQRASSHQSTTTEQMTTFRHIKEHTRQRLHTEVDLVIEKVFGSALHQHRISSILGDELYNFTYFCTQIGQSLQVTRLPLDLSLDSRTQEEQPNKNNNIRQRHFLDSPSVSHSTSFSSYNQSPQHYTENSTIDDYDDDDDDDVQFLEEVVPLNKLQKTSDIASGGLTESVLSKHVGQEDSDHGLDNISIQTVEFKQYTDDLEDSEGNESSETQHQCFTVKFTEPNSNKSDSFALKPNDNQMLISSTNSNTNKRKSIPSSSELLPHKESHVISSETVDKQMSKKQAQTEVPSPPANNVFEARGLFCSANQCKRANELFQSENDLYHHYTVKHRAFAFFCYARACGSSFDQRCKLNAHLIELHRNVINWKCPNCPDLPACQSHLQLERHQYMNHQRGEFVCNLPACGLVSEYRSVALKHFLDSHKSILSL